MTKKTTQLNLRTYFTKIDKNPYDLLNWHKVDAEILDFRTKAVIFSQKQIEFPIEWSQNAVNIVAQKYFAGDLNSDNRESSLKQLIDRVVNTITEHGVKNRYFASKQEAKIFSSELKYILASQRASFNSPVWFNIGVPSRAQQASACFILNVEDDMRSILNWYTEEGLIFKGGSGSGINISKLRASSEGLSTSSGMASGPLSFMRGADTSAGTIKSGGKTRRAAKMVILNVDHPDVEDFIWCKAREEDKARALEEAGFDVGVDGSDLYNIQYQNANNSVRVSDKFMQAVLDDEDWQLKNVNSKTQPEIAKTLKARNLFKQICEAAWECADPGIQFDDTINHWHTAPNAGRINASNPCSEYMHLDNSACNLASINLMKFINDQGQFLIDDFLQTVEILILAQEILVGYSDYPTPSIAKTARAYRQLGLGYANLGAVLMSKGLPYDSDTARSLAGVITAMMSGHAYLVSAKIAQRVGAFEGYLNDDEGTLKVIAQHREALNNINAQHVDEELLTTAAVIWDEALSQAKMYGVRNSQVSVLAPTGTIGLMMDCDTTGVEPDLGLVKFKTLVGGGHMKFVNQTIPRGLTGLGYNEDQIKDIVSYIEENASILGAPHIKEEDLDVFACSIGDNVISPMGHVKMMAAVQPFLSGAISKTVNMPEQATVKEVEDIYMQAWKLGVKAIAIYRDNCKVSQPVAVKKKEDTSGQIPNLNNSVQGAVRRQLPSMRNSKTFKFRIANIKGFMTVGEFEDGAPGEIFIVVAKQGSTLAGVMDALAISVSHGLQYGVPLKSYVKAFINMSFTPSGLTDDEDIRLATSFVDYIFRKLAKVYLLYEDLVDLGIINFSEQADQEKQKQTTLIEEANNAQKSLTHDLKSESNNSQSLYGSKKLIDEASSPLCITCGNHTQRSGSCYVCSICGSTTGCS